MSVMLSFCVANEYTRAIALLVIFVSNVFRYYFCSLTGASLAFSLGETLKQRVMI